MLLTGTIMNIDVRWAHIVIHVTWAQNLKLNHSFR